MSQESKSVRIFKVNHAEPNDFRWDFILLPYGEYYAKTAELLKARPGDTLRFYEGRDVEIQAVRLIEDEVLCNILCRMRYGIVWEAAFSRWLRYARLEGHGKSIIVKDKCILVAFKYL